MKKYEEPKLDVIRFDMAETLTSGGNVNTSMTFGEDVDEW